MAPALQVQMLAQGSASDAIDPYLRVAQATGWRGLLPAPGTPAAPAWPVAIELAAGASVPVLGPGFAARPATHGEAFRTATADTATISALLAHADVKRVLLAAPMEPARAHTLPAAPGLSDQPPDASLDLPRPNDTLLGVIDNGCPFAHPDLARAGGLPRVLRLWNQQASDVAARAPARFGYGAELSRADLVQLMHRHGGGPSGVATEAVYRAAGLTATARRHSHGAHVLGMLAGARHWRPGMRSSSKQGIVTLRNGQISATSDLAFVQLPQHLVDAVSVTNMQVHALDGLRYLVSLAVDKKYARLGVVFAYECWVGPHDGRGWFEQAADAVLASARANGLDVELFVIAGNGRDRAAHAVLEGGAAATRVCWHLPPGNEQACWLELWPPAGAWTQPPRMRLDTPAGASTGWLDWGGTWRLSQDGRTAATLVTMDRSALSPGRPVALLRLEPTCALRGGAAAEHGLWTLTLEPAAGAPPLPRIDARLGRLEPDPQAPQRARSARFVGRSAAQSVADALDTLNGHAFGRAMAVVGAYRTAGFPYAREPGVDARGRPHPPSTGAHPHPPLRGASTRYSGAAQTPQNTFKPRWSIDVDDGLLLAGCLGLGNAAGAVTRLSGTSAAAPLVAARWADGVLQSLPPVAGSIPDPALGSRLVR